MLEEEAADAGQASMGADAGEIRSAGEPARAESPVLDLSKIEAGRMDLYPRPSACRALRRIAAVVQPLAARNGNRLVTTCAPEVAEMRADLTKVRQILFNLLANACKFTERGTVTLAVPPGGGCPEGRRPGWSSGVADTGIGADGEGTDRAPVQAFSQAEATTTRRYGGTGLGLALPPAVPAHGERGHGDGRGPRVGHVHGTAAARGPEPGPALATGTERA
jgi:signal transduction histidine kinase